MKITEYERAVRFLRKTFNREERLRFRIYSAASATVRTSGYVHCENRGKGIDRYATNAYHDVVSRETCRAFWKNGFLRRGEKRCSPCQAVEDKLFPYA